MSQKTNRVFFYNKTKYFKLFSKLLISFGIFLTTYLFIFESFIWRHLETWHIERFAPTSGEWQEIPFYYTLGSWPRKFANKPIFYKLPYEKGPPFQFVGHIVARWAYPDIQVTYEGPKTPQGLGNRRHIKECFKSSYSLSCLNLRRKTLSRHINEIQSRMGQLGVGTWEFKWFTVSTPDLPPEDQMQGVYIMAKNASKIQDRFILIQNNGIHQTLFLERPNSHPGQLAFETFTQALGSLRNYGELTTGRTKISQELKGVNLAKVNELTDPNQVLDTYARIQSLLISKISVDPANFDSYFHLAGTSYLLNKNKSIPLPEGILASENMRSVTQFALDISPKDPKTLQIQRLILDLKL